MIWYALEVHAPRTLSVCDDLRERGYETFTPVETRRKRMANGKRKPVTTAAMPGYVFIGFSGSINWHAVRDVDGVWHEMTYANGTPAAIPDKVMRRVINMTPDDYSKHSKKIHVGKTAEITDGPFAGHMVDVTKIKGDRARVVFHVILTGIKELDMSIDSLEAA